MFVTFEGPEGSGKTTQAGLLSSWLTQLNTDHILTKEPGTIFSKECQDIRRLLLDPSNKLDPTAELFLYLADRAQHVGNCIKPALEEGKWVISDRFSFSTYAYQGCGRGFLFRGSDGDYWFNETLEIASWPVQPDFTFVMDLPVEIGLDRARQSNVEFEGGDRMEREELEFHKKLRDGFLKVAKIHHRRCMILNAEKSIEELHEEVKKKIRSLR
jgi:dTMP kinase